jgi:hypothetical protein
MYYFPGKMDLTSPAMNTRARKRLRRDWETDMYLPSSTKKSITYESSDDESDVENLDKVIPTVSDTIESKIERQTTAIFLSSDVSSDEEQTEETPTSVITSISKRIERKPILSFIYASMEDENPTILNRFGQQFKFDDNEYNCWLVALDKQNPADGKIIPFGNSNCSALPNWLIPYTQDYKVLSVDSRVDKRVTFIDVIYNRLMIGYNNGYIVAIGLPIFRAGLKYQQLDGPVTHIIKSQIINHFIAITGDHVYLFNFENSKPNKEFKLTFGGPVVGTLSYRNEHFLVQKEGDIREIKDDDWELVPSAQHALIANIGRVVQIESSDVGPKQYYSALVQHKDFLATIRIDKNDGTTTIISKARTYITKNNDLNVLVGEDKVFIAPLYTGSVKADSTSEVFVYYLSNLAPHPVVLRVIGGYMIHTKIFCNFLVITTINGYINIFDTYTLEMLYLIEKEKPIQSAYLIQNRLITIDLNSDISCTRLPTESCECDVHAHPNTVDIPEKTIWTCSNYSEVNEYTPLDLTA